jgi:hypothetical protein
LGADARIREGAKRSGTVRRHRHHVDMVMVFN